MCESPFCNNHFIYCKFTDTCANKRLFDEIITKTYCDLLVWTTLDTVKLTVN